MGYININGKRYETKGKTIQVCIGNNNIQIDGNIVEGSMDGEVFKHDISIVACEGTLVDVSATCCHIMKVDGDVTGNVKSSSGDVEITGNVEGGVQSSSGDIEIGGDVIKGSVKTSSGDIVIGGSIGGNANTTSGDITIKNKK
jgi:uncharacterized protein (DUF342 family)